MAYYINQQALKFPVVMPPKPANLQFGSAMPRQVMPNTAGLPTLSDVYHRTLPGLRQV